MRRLFTAFVTVLACTGSFAADLPRGIPAVGSEQAVPLCKRMASPGEFDARCDCPRLGYRGEIPVPPMLNGGF